MTDHGFRQWTRAIIFTISAVYLVRAGWLFWHMMPAGGRLARGRLRAAGCVAPALEDDEPHPERSTKRRFAFCAGRAFIG